jgi:uncharacterized protein (TIGR02466 family)
MKFEYWFPTVLGVHYAPDICKLTTKDKIDNWIKDGKHTAYLEACREDNLTTSYFKWHDTLGDLNLTELRQEILNQAAAFIAHMGLSVAVSDLNVDSWINFFYPNQTEHQHNHYGNFVSGVYYVTGSEKSGAYRFFDPAVQKTMWKGAYLSQAENSIVNLTSGQYLPEGGKMILFPSWLEHSVLKNTSNEPRISIAFNINLNKKNEKDVPHDNWSPAFGI